MESQTELITTLTEFVEQAGDFATTQAPLVIQEILTLGLIQHGMGLGIGIFLVLLFGYWSRCCSKVLKSVYDEGLWDAAGAVNTILSVCMGGVVAYNVFYMAMVVYAPRLFVLRYLSTMFN